MTEFYKSATKSQLPHVVGCRLVNSGQGHVMFLQDIELIVYHRANPPPLYKPLIIRIIYFLTGCAARGLKLLPISKDFSLSKNG